VSDPVGAPEQARDPLRSIRAMIEVAPPIAQLEIARALQARLNEPKTAAARRIAELGLLAACLEDEEQDPERLPRIKADMYDEKRNGSAPGAPSAETLARRYGSWKRACYAAYGLRLDGSKAAPGKPWPTGTPFKLSQLAYDRDECIASVRACAQSIGRRPTSSAYAKWRSNRLARARTIGEEMRIAPMGRILTVLAPERTKRDGWKIALTRVFD